MLLGYFDKMRFKLWLVRSTSPVDNGRFGVLNLGEQPSLCNIKRVSWLVKFAPLSLWQYVATPNVVKKSISALHTDLADKDLKAYAEGHLVCKSVIPSA